MMNTDTRITMWLTVALLSLSWDVRAEDAKSEVSTSPARGIVLSAGLGSADKGLLCVAAIQAARGSRVYTVRMASAARLEILGDSPTPSTTEYGILYGWLHAGRKEYSSVSLGLSRVSSVRTGQLLHAANCLFCSGQYEKVVTHTVGIAFEAKGVFSSKGGGLGLGVFGNLNSKASFIGVGITMDLGGLR
ncbi:MAG: hypothetical protein K1Y01_02250 [Vicinamibacteria bacterium]|nr:hypothetical protein [Vicinamibacteria bacterium]